MSTLKQILELASDIKADFKKGELSAYESLDIACKIKQIETFERAFMLTDDGNIDHPSALEAVGIALGISVERGRISAKIDGISDDIDRIATALEKQAEKED